MANITTLRDDDLVKVYIALRDRRALRKAAFEAEDSVDDHKMDKIEGIMLRRLSESGHESVRTAFGTAYKVTKTRASVADWDSLIKFIIANDAWELLTRAVSKTAVEQHRQVSGEIPPGVNISAEVVVNFLRS